MLIAEKIKGRKDVLMLNIFACYGYGEKESRFPTYAIKNVINGKNIEINQNAVFDYLWIEDMEKIVHYFIENKQKNNIINITPTQSISLLEIAEIVNGFENNKVDIVIKNKTMNNEYTGDNALLLSKIPNMNFTDIKQGLKKLYNYYKQIK
jgi:GDP-L-fucose synthase